MSEIPSSGAAQAIYEELLDAAWTRVQAGPVERERRGGPFSVDSVAGALGLAGVDLIVLQQEAARAQLYLVSDDVDELLQRPLALLAADALSTLLCLAQALARAIGHPELAAREELDRLITEQFDVYGLSDATEHGLLVEAVEQVARITSEGDLARRQELRADRDPRPRRDRDHRRAERHDRAAPRPGGRRRQRRQLLSVVRPLCP